MLVTKTKAVGYIISNRTSCLILSLFTKVSLVFSCKLTKMACFQNFLLAQLNFCGNLSQQFNITYLLRVPARLPKEPEQVFNFLSLHNEPEPRPSRKGWSGSGCCVAIFYCQIQHRTLKTAWPSAWDTRRWPWEGEPENAAGRGQESHAGRTATAIHSPHVFKMSTWGETDGYLLVGAGEINVDKMSTLILFLLHLTSTWHFVKPRWKVVGYENRNLPLSHNREGLVGDHFDHQPDNRNALLCKSGGSHFGNQHISVTTKGGCLWQQNNGNVKIRIFWWNISLMVTPACAESSVNTAARSSTPRPETANIAASRPAVTRCWICGKALKSVPTMEPTPASAAGNSSYQFGQMPDIAAMPVGRKATASVK